MKAKNAYSGAHTKKTIAIYAKSVAKYPLLLLSLGVTGVLMQITTLAQPLYLREFFNLIARGDTSASVVSVLIGILVTIALIMAAHWILMRLHIASLLYIDGRLMRDLYQRAFDYLIGHSYNFFTNQFAGTLTRRIGRFSKSFETIFDAIVIQFLPAILFISGAVAVISMQNIVLGAVFGVWVIVVVAVQVFLIRLNNPLRVIRAAEDSKLTGTLSDAIGNQNTISLFAGAAFEQARLREVTHSWYRALIRTWHMDEVIWGVLGLFMLIINIGMLYGALHFWQRGMLTVGDFALIQAYLLTTFDRLFAINREIRNFNEAFADASEMVEILEQPHDVQDTHDAKKLAISSAHISFENVRFYFSEAQIILPDFSLTVSGGEKIALVGPSGAGKTTITKLLLRLYDVKGGSISIDGQNIAEVTQDSLRESIAFVPQEPILFHRTLMDNIRYGRRDATDEEVKEAARQAHCEEFIERTPLGYMTYVGERGIKLSGGERQRIAIARAILKNAPILVLDEATSSLDSESEALIQDALEKLMEGKTVIAIAHRLSTVMKMDRIVVIENGRIATSGTHDELVRHEGGLYKKLWEIQAGGFIADDLEKN